MTDKKNGLSVTFSLYGIMFFLVFLTGGIWMVYFPEAWKPEG